MHELAEKEGFSLQRRFESAREKALACREGRFEPAEEALARRKRRLRPAVNKSRQRGGFAETFLPQKSCIRKSCETKAVKQSRKEGGFGKTFQHVRCSGCRGGGGSDWLVSASLTPWMASIFTDFIPCKAFKGVKERAQKKEIIG